MRAAVTAVNAQLSLFPSDGPALQGLCNRLAHRGLVLADVACGPGELGRHRGGARLWRHVVQPNRIAPAQHKTAVGMPAHQLTKPAVALVDAPAAGGSGGRKAVRYSSAAVPAMRLAGLLMATATMQPQRATCQNYCVTAALMKLCGRGHASSHMRAPVGAVVAGPAGQRSSRQRAVSADSVPRGPVTTTQLCQQLEWPPQSCRQALTTAPGRGGSGRRDGDSRAWRLQLQARAAAPARTVLASSRPPMPSG